MVSVIRGVESDRKKKEKLRWMDCSEMNSRFVKRTASVTRGVELVETEKFSQAQCEARQMGVSKVLRGSAVTL